MYKDQSPLTSPSYMNQRLGFNTCGVYSGVARDDTLLLVSVGGSKSGEFILPERERVHHFWQVGFSSALASQITGQHEKNS